jgi:hypothetical protein
VNDDTPADEAIYLEFDDALELYGAIIGGTRRQAAGRLNSPPGSKGALGRPRTYAAYEDADLPLQSTVLAHVIAESQTFIGTPTCACPSAVPVVA